MAPVHFCIANDDEDDDDSAFCDVCHSIPCVCCMCCASHSALMPLRPCQIASDAGDRDVDGAPAICEHLTIEEICSLFPILEEEGYRELSPNTRETTMCPVCISLCGLPDFDSDSDVDVGVAPERSKS